MVVAVVVMTLAAGCSPRESGVAAVSVIDGQWVVAVLGCKDGPDNVGIRVKGPENREGSSQVVGEWTRSEALPRKTIFNPASPGEEWTVDTPLVRLDPDVAHYVAFGVQGGKSPGGTRHVQFSAAEVQALRPGQWLYSTQEAVGDDTDKIRNVNLVVSGIDELKKIDDDGCAG